MAQDYNSQLISDLYKTDPNDRDNALSILGEMESIGDEVFLYPIKDAYLKFHGKYFSHYFVSSLLRFKSDEVLVVIKDLVDVILLSVNDFSFSLPVFEKFKYSDPRIDQKISQLLSDESRSELSNIDAEHALSYLRSVGNIDQYSGLLFRITMDDTANAELRLISLHYYIVAHPSDSLKLLLSLNFADLSKNLQVLIAKELTHWQGTVVESLYADIISTGTRRAVEIIVQHQETKKRRLSAVGPSTDF